MRVKCQMEKCSAEDFGDFEGRVYALCGGEQWIAESNEQYPISPMNGNRKSKNQQIVK